MLTNLFISGAAVAGIAILWRALRMRHGNLVRSLRNTLGFFATSLLCGFCFTYWTAFLFLLLFNPLQGWQPPFRHNLSPSAGMLITFLVSWMALSFVSVTFRFVFVLLKETVDHFTHHINPNPNHIHEHRH